MQVQAPTPAHPTRAHTTGRQVDDDIVRMEKDSLAYLAAHKLFHPSAAFRKFGVASANVINHGHLAYLHEAFGAWRPAKQFDYHR